MQSSRTSVAGPQFRVHDRILQTASLLGFSAQAVSSHLDTYAETQASLSSFPFVPVFQAPQPESTIGPWQDQPHHSIGQLQLVKVDDQTKRNIQELHVTQELRFVDRQDFLDTFEFQQEATLSQNVEAQWLFKHETFVFDPDQALVDCGYLAQLQFAHLAPLVNALDQTRPFKPVNLNGGADRHAAQLISFIVEWVHGKPPTPRKQRKRRILSCAQLNP